MVIKMTFIVRLDQLIKTKNIDAKTLSETLRIGKNSITYWRKNENLPSGDILIKLADYFGVSIDYLVGRTDNPEINK